MARRGASYRSDSIPVASAPTRADACGRPTSTADSSAGMARVARASRVRACTGCTASRGGATARCGSPPTTALSGPRPVTARHGGCGRSRPAGRTAGRNPGSGPYSRTTAAAVARARGGDLVCDASRSPPGTRRRGQRDTLATCGGVTRCSAGGRHAVGRHRERRRVRAARRGWQRSAATASSARYLRLPAWQSPAGGAWCDRRHHRARGAARLVRGRMGDRRG